MVLEQPAPKAPDPLTEDLRIAEVMDACSPKSSPAPKGEHDVTVAPISPEEPLVFDLGVVPDDRCRAGISESPGLGGVNLQAFHMAEAGWTRQGKKNPRVGFKGGEPQFPEHIVHLWEAREVCHREIPASQDWHEQGQSRGTESGFHDPTGYVTNGGRLRSPESPHAVDGRKEAHQLSRLRFESKSHMIFRVFPAPVKEAVPAVLTQVGVQLPEERIVDPVEVIRRDLDHLCCHETSAWRCR